LIDVHVVVIGWYASRIRLIEMVGRLMNIIKMSKHIDTVD